MPSISDTASPRLDDGLQYSISSAGDNPKAGTVKGAVGRQVFQLGRKADSGESQVLARLVLQHAPEQPTPMSITDMMLHLSAMTSTLQGQTVKIAETMIDHNRNMIEKKNDERVKMMEKVQKMQEKIEKQQKSAETWGWIGTIAGAVITAASLGSLGPVAATCMLLGTGIGIGNQIATSTGAYDRLAKSDPDAAKALNYSMFALQITLSLVGVGAAMKSGATVLQGGGEVAAKSGAETAAKSGANIAGEAANAAGKSGTAMTGATSSQQMADDLVRGVSDVSRSVSKSQQAVDQAVDAGQVAGRSGANQASGAGAKAADGSVGSGAKNANIGDNADDLAKIEKMERFERNASRVGHVMQGTVGLNKMADDIELAVLGSRATNTRADLQHISRTVTFQQSVLNEIVDGLSSMIEQIQSSASAAMEAESKIYAAKMTVASNISANTSAVV